MAIEYVDLTNFMAFEKLKIKFSKGINVLFGENSTGKTAILKLLYSISKSSSDFYGRKNDGTKDEFEQMIVSKLIGTFRCDNDAVGRLVGRKQGSNRTDIKIGFSASDFVSIGFSNRSTKHVDLSTEVGKNAKVTPVFIPPKEIISSTSNFTSLYEDYHIDFEETYYDLAKLLLRPLSRGTNAQWQQELLSSFEEMFNGNVIQKDNKFYLKMPESGEYEMGLVSEGYRKLSTLNYLIRSGSLGKNSILFWDEPESNLNPKMIPYLVKFLMELSSKGVQIFISTHSYFIQQEFNLYSSYKNANTNNIDIKYISLFKDPDNIRSVKYENSNVLNEIIHNSIMEEFDALYDREIRWSND